jgi:hypothetical protein
MIGTIYFKLSGLSVINKKMIKKDWIIKKIRMIKHNK